MINLFLALVIEGYLETLRENETIISPSMFETLLDKWSEYDPEGTGFLTSEDLAFLLYELPPPLGLKDENMQSLKQDELRNKYYLIYMINF